MRCCSHSTIVAMQKVLIALHIPLKIVAMETHVTDAVA